MRRYFADVRDVARPARGSASSPWAQAGNDRDGFNMTYLGCAVARSTTASAACTARSRSGSCAPSGPGCSRARCPVGSITNGVHLATWTSPAMSRAARRPRRAGVTGDDFATTAAGLDGARAVAGAVRGATAPARARARATSRAASPSAATTPALLCAHARRPRRAALLIGFARRFAPYKRADLLLRDPERLAGPRSAAPTVRCASSSPARPTRTTAPARTLLQRSRGRPRAARARRQGLLPRGLRHGRSPARWSRASTCG